MGLKNGIGKAGMVFLLILLIFPSTPAFSHPGGLDVRGGHVDRNTGTYHCHGEPCVRETASLDEAYPNAEATLIGVVDGDTIKVDYRGMVEKVRLIGVNTPERGERLYEEATLFTAREVAGKALRLEFDRGRRDRYGRLLAYVYLPDGAMVNADLIRHGYSCAYTRFPFKYIDRFRDIEEEAKGAGVAFCVNK